MNLHVLLVCACFCVQFALSFEESFEQLLHQSENDGLLSQQLEQIVLSKHQIDPSNAYYLNLLGVMAARYDDNKALDYFRSASELVGHLNYNFAANYCMLMMKLSKDLNELISPRVNSYMLAVALIDILWTTEDYDSFRTILTKALQLWPERYEFWNKFVQFSMLKLVSDPKILDTDISLGSMIELGLSVFPKCPGLRFLNGIKLFNKEHFACAAENFAIAIEMELLAVPALPINGQVDAIRVNQRIALDYSNKQGSQANNGLPCKSQFVTQQRITASFFDSFDYSSFQMKGLKRLTDNCDTSQLPICLHIGCSQWERCVKKGWVVVDALLNVSTHMVSTASNLSAIENDTVAIIYSSHTLEHLSHSLGGSAYSGQGEVCAALAEWNRVMVDGAVLLLSVPDIEILASMLMNPKRSHVSKKLIMTVMYGGQDDDFNFHKTGFFFEYLRELLQNSLFCDIERIHTSFGLFNDTSDLEIFGQKISINLRARACKDPGNANEKSEDCRGGLNHLN